MMTKRAEYRFKIDGGYTPEALPSKRLGEYLVEIAKLLGEPEHVHFDRVRSGSTVLAHTVDEPAVPKVRERVLSASLPRPPADIVRQRTKLDTMLAADNATAVLNEVGARAVTLRFPGRDLAGANIPPVSQEGAVQGELLRVGGADLTAHALIRQGEEIVSCEVTRDLARGLAPLLYRPVRIYGQGRWRRAPEGRWSLESFRGYRFEELDGASLRDAVAHVRGHAGASTGPEDIEALLRLRSSE